MNTTDRCPQPGSCRCDYEKVRVAQQQVLLNRVNRILLDNYRPKPKRDTHSIACFALIGGVLVECALLAWIVLR